MPYYEYHCEDHHSTEVLVSYKNRKDVVPCEVCGKDAYYAISLPSVHLEGVSGDFPGAAMRWDRDHRKRAQPK
jgi:putative FmdB family regulatory protein